VILKVDGEDAAARLARYARYRATSTPQSRDLVAASAFLQGSEGSVAVLTVRDGANRVREVRLPRRVAHTPTCRGCRMGDMLRWLPDSIGYADLDRLTVTMVDSMFERFRHARGIVFDMRGYPLGTAWSIAPRLTDRARTVAARFRRPLALAPRGGTGDEGTEIAMLEFEQLLPRTTQWRYHGPTVMLIDERTISQAEHTGLFFEAANGTTFIGSPTTGANGDVTTLVVPGGIVIGFTGHDVRHADGRQLQRLGLVPEIRVDPTIAGIRAGRDEVLERAVAYLRERGSRRPPGTCADTRDGVAASASS
jgi:C-terminal processing protease CtpA/Prc